MQRKGRDYYEYRDTAMSRNAPFRPEWIRVLQIVDNNNPKKSRKAFILNSKSNDFKRQSEGGDN